MTESSLHQHYKEKIKYALIKAGWQEACNEAKRRTSTDRLGTHEFLDYRLDVYATKGGIHLGIEVDGTKSGGGHLTQRAQKSDKARAKALYNQHGILVLRLEFYQIKGCTDDEIIEEIEHEVRRYVPTFFC